MDKNSIKKYAVWARQELISRVSKKALQYGVSENEIIDAAADTINGHLLAANEKKQRQALIKRIRQIGYQQTMEEAAYTWFNRFTALRFMEINGYLPTHVRVFTDEQNEFKPQILAEAIHLELDGLNMEKVYELKDQNKTDELYKYLLITQCNALSSILPGMFTHIEDYTELLFPDNLLREGSVVEQMITLIPQSDFDVEKEGQVEIIGWLYQYYISEKHEEVVDPLRGKIVKKEDVPAATQLFTTDWVVRYIVDNSIGRYWMERNPESRLQSELKYFVAPKNGKTVTVNESIVPQDVTVFDPCVGSGHFLVYAFDVLMKIYREYGYSDRDAAKEIVEKNLFGLDLDNRAIQLAYFAVMMKARQYDRRIFNKGVHPNIYCIEETNSVENDIFKIYGDKAALARTVHDAFIDAKEYGSLITIPVSVDELNALKACVETIQKNASGDDLFEQMRLNMALEAITPILDQAVIMADKYAVVATNPPYFTKYDDTLKKYLTDNYKDYSGDLFSVFTYRNMFYCKTSGYVGLMTPNVWLSIKTYEPLRRYILGNKQIVTLTQMAHGAFNEVACVDVCAFVIQNYNNDEEGVYFKLSSFKGDMETQREWMLKALKEDCEYKYYTKASNLALVPDSPITAFCASERMLKIYEKAILLKEIADPKQGLATADNNRFLRQWFEVAYSNVKFDCASLEETETNGYKWYPYNKGGDFRKWYGNNDYIVNWESNGHEIRNFTDEKGKLRSRPQNTQYYFKECISWSLISSYTIAFRYKPQGHIFDIAGMSCFDNSNIPLLYLLALNNSCLIGNIMLMLAPTINYQSGNIANIPVIYDEEKSGEVCALAEENIRIAKEDWDEYETSWDFTENPLVNKGYTLVSDAYYKYKEATNTRFEKLAQNERYLNKLFLQIYDVEGEISPDISRRDISAAYIFDSKDEIPDDIKESYYVRTREDVIKNLISYAVGCMFGRYSLDSRGLACAGEKFDTSKYSAFPADKDNIIPICDDDYFDDDITGRFIKWVETVYGTTSLESNLRFIADALGGKGTPRDVIRSYFLNDFYADHLKNYQKRPIYWLFDSGKKNGFKALIYMHRYQPDTIARMRTDYVHEQQSRYRTAIADLEQRVNSASTGERVKLSKQLQKLQDQANEIRGYEEKIHHLADMMIPIDLDDGVKVNYAKFADVLAKIK